MIRIEILSLAFLLAASCTSSHREEKHDQPVVDSIITVSVDSLNSTGPINIAADSMEVIFYKNPDGDSARYTRYYTYVATSEPKGLKFLALNLNNNPRIQDSVWPCRSEGKIFLHQHTKQIKTLYFASRSKNCSYLYYIHNGRFYYFPISTQVSELLQKLKHQSKEG